MTRRPVVAVIGRPNVGKSTLFNRIVGHRVAIVEPRPGVTRDRKTLEVEWQGAHFCLVDTGGWTPAGDALDAKVSAQSERAVADADLVVVVVDGAIGVTEEDDRVADLVRRGTRPVILAVNKIDSSQREPLIWEFLSLGLGEPMALSALHGHHTGDLLDRIVAVLAAAGHRLDAGGGTDSADDGLTAGDRAADRDDAGTSAGTQAVEDAEVAAVAVVGRPNVGKSTLFNRLIGEERAVVHDLAGTTRDSVDTVVETDQGRLRFVDTAGMRRRSRVDDATEYYSVLRALRSVDDADVALLVIDATEGVTHQDQRLAERVDASGCPVVIVCNKWELLDADSRAEVRAQAADRLKFLGEAPVLTISALTGKNVARLLPAIGDAVEAYHRRAPTRQVNDVIQRAQRAHPAPDGGRVLYATQGATRPPTFTLFVNREVPRTWLRYLENELRSALDLGATPIKLRVRRRS